ncbi:MAG: 4-hydroxy-3-methylbut-2-enyl diphosphate reductase [Nitrospirae bacterium]|nr:MAG: 4-hydroxy-3-methylbut-2-enyl diphosphate reductase [Nitrospirota bacterium]
MEHYLVGKGISVITAKRAGFCFGVKRAVDMAFAAAEANRNVYTLGPIIHNPQVIGRLKEKGVRPITSINNRSIKTLLIRTHGIPRDISEQLASKRYAVIDTTCPFVKKAQQYAKLLRERGYQVVIIGDAGHPEVQGLMSYAGADALVLSRDMVMQGSAAWPALKPKVGVVVQTTQPVAVLKTFVHDAVDLVKELKVFNTICNSTALRLKETQDMAKKVDVMIVVGGRNSANTTQLAAFCRSMSVPTHHIETADEIRSAWFEGVTSVGITAGASTPDWIIAGAGQRVREIAKSRRGGEHEHATERRNQRT